MWSFIDSISFWKFFEIIRSLISFILYSAYSTLNTNYWRKIIDQKNWKNFCEEKKFENKQKVKLKRQIFEFLVWGKSLSTSEVEIYSKSKKVAEK